MNEEGEGWKNTRKMVVNEKRNCEAESELFQDYVEIGIRIRNEGAEFIQVFLAAPFLKQRRKVFSGFQQQHACRERERKTGTCRTLSFFCCCATKLCKKMETRTRKQQNFPSPELSLKFSARLSLDDNFLGQGRAGWR